MGAKQQFSKYAFDYDNYNVIQNQVSKSLVESIQEPHFENILDLGCGTGITYKEIIEAGISFEHFSAFDFSEQMLVVHPDEERITKICGSFNEEFIDKLPKKAYDLLISSSAIQWSNDLDFTLGEISKLSDNLKLSIFTSGTFKTLHGLVDVTSPIHSKEILEKKIKQFFPDAEISIVNYVLKFESVREMFRYIKKSGVSSGEKKLSIKQMRFLMKNYPLDYLEFEVMFISSH